MKKKMDVNKRLEDIIFSFRWILYPINIGLMGGLVFYVGHFLKDGVMQVFNGFNDMDSLMLFMLGLVDAAMVANLIIMIIQGGHQIFISKFHVDQEEAPQFLDHMDTGILKVKVALSISGITLVQILRDFFNIEKAEWTLVVHRAEIHAVTLLSALVMAIIWRVMHPSEEKEHV